MLMALSAAGAPLGGTSSDASVAAAGAERCADCRHPQAVADYARTGMARALGPLVPGELLGLQTVPAGETGYRYHFEQAGGLADDGSVQAWLVETWSPREDAPVEQQVRSTSRIAFAIGAGELDRSYVAEQHGMHWFAPLEVLSAGVDGPRRAALAPGHMIEPTLRLTSPITEECLACHTDHLPPREYPRNLVAPREARWTPRGISCGACHGDVEGHADWREAELSGERPAGRDPLLPFGALELHQRLSVCARCHLQGDARIALRAGERGIPPPGGDLLERWAVYVPAVSDDAVGFVSQVERLTASPCFLRSLRRPGPKLSCEVCHDPHRSTADARERRRVRDGCLACHEPFQSSTKGKACTLPRGERGEQDCVDCHMPTGSCGSRGRPPATRRCACATPSTAACAPSAGPASRLPPTAATRGLRSWRR
jgi:predicted CXXCH cytochrome family protein